MNIFFTKFFIAITISIFLSLLYFFLSSTLFTLDNRLRDFMFVKRGEIVKKKTSQVVIIDIDDKSLEKYGQWPWQRDLFADLLYKLTDVGAGIIALDIVFSEEDRSSPHRLATKYPQIKDSLENYDEILATCFTQTPVIGGYVFRTKSAKTENMPKFEGVFREKNVLVDNIIKSQDVLLNIDILENALYSTGFFNIMPDKDGIIRTAPLIMKYDGFIYPSLALEMIRIASGENIINLIGDSNYNLKYLEFGAYQIPLDEYGRMMINFRGKKNYFQYISASDIIDGNFKIEDIKNKFVFIGTSSIGLHDLRSTAYDLAIPGVEIHANIVDNILDGDFMHKDTDIIYYDIIVIWIVVFISIFLLSFLKSWMSIVLSLIIFYGFFELFYILLFEYGLFLNILFPFIAYSLTLLISTFIDYITASRQKEEAKRMLGKKVSPAVMEYLLKHSQEELIIPKEIEATILFSDIRSFTSISEKIGSPDRLIHLLNRYMTPMVENIVSKNGTIDKFIGDAIMAYWNAPIEIKNHADKALQSAIEQIEMLIEINKDIFKEYNVNIAIGIGIHTGRVTAGDMGSTGRSDYTIIGDNVNLASRLEGLTKQYDAQILISKATFLQLKNNYKIREIDMVEVKGKHEAVEIYEVLCNNKRVTKNELNLYQKATDFFRVGDVNNAYSLYMELQNENPSKLYQFYIERCLKFINNPKLEFTPILKMTTK